MKLDDESFLSKNFENEGDDFDFNLIVVTTSKVVANNLSSDVH